MIDILHREFIYIWYYFEIQFRQIFPYWVIGIVIGSVISVFVKDRIHGAVRAMCNKKLGISGIAVASVLGIVSPLCMYGTIPLAASFSESGVRDDWLAAFMMSSILLNPQLIIYSTAVKVRKYFLRKLFLSRRRLLKCQNCFISTLRRTFHFHCSTMRLHDLPD